MKMYKEILNLISLYPFNPLYNLGINKYSLKSNDNYLSERKGKLELGDFSNIQLPLIFEISDESFQLLTGKLSESKLSNPEIFEELYYENSLFLSYLISVVLGKEEQCWWIDTLIQENLELLTLDYLLTLQAEYRNLICEIFPELNIYIPYHWAELALLSVSENSYLEEITLDDTIDKEHTEIIQKEFNYFLDYIKKNKLSKVHKEVLLKFLILAHKEGRFHLGQPFPFNTKGKKIEKVNIKIIKIPKAITNKN